MHDIKPSESLPETRYDDRGLHQEWGGKKLHAFNVLYMISLQPITQRSSKMKGGGMAIKWEKKKLQPKLTGP